MARPKRSDKKAQRHTVLLRPDLWDALEQQATERGETVNRVIEECLEQMHTKEQATMNSKVYEISRLEDAIATADFKADFRGGSALDEERCDEWAQEANYLRSKLASLQAEVRTEREAVALGKLQAAATACEGFDAWHACNAIVRVADDVTGDIAQEVRNIVNARQDGRTNDEKWAAVRELLNR